MSGGGSSESRPKVVFDHTDPGLRPFIEVEAKIALSILDDGRASGSPARDLVAAVADTATEDAETGAREMSDQIPGVRRLLPVCQVGCSYCCYGAVFASAPEILRIAAHLKETRSPDALAELASRAADTAARITPMTLDERAVAKVPCPLLDEKTGACGVYPVRPVACRAYHSGSVEACKSASERCESSPVIPINPALFHVAHAYSFGMMTGCVAAGLDAGPYDLAATLPVALGSDLSEAWLRGEKVLPATKASDAVRAGYEVTLRELGDDLRAGRLEDAARVAAKADPDARRRERNRKKRARRDR